MALRLVHVGHDVGGRIRWCETIRSWSFVGLGRELRISRDASFSTHAARSARAAAAAYRSALACELIGAVRALRMAGTEPAGEALGPAFRHVAQALPLIAEDHALSHEIALARMLVGELAQFWPVPAADTATAPGARAALPAANTEIGMRRASADRDAAIREPAYEA
jgi:histidine ammonia-lyase